MAAVSCRAVGVPDRGAAVVGAARVGSGAGDVATGARDVGAGLDVVGLGVGVGLLGEALGEALSSDVVSVPGWAERGGSSCWARKANTRAAATAASARTTRNVRRPLRSRSEGSGSVGRSSSP